MGIATEYLTRLARLHREALAENEERDRVKRQARINELYEQAMKLCLVCRCSGECLARKYGFGPIDQQCEGGKYENLDARSAPLSRGHPFLP